MSKVEDFLSVQEEQEIVSAIRQAELNTSGEIRVHIEKSTTLSHYDRALEVFSTLKMYNTKQENAVLIYVAVEDHKFVIYGDKGIDTVVPKNFWDTTKNTMQEQFKKGNFKQGIIDGVLKAGEELKAHFPWQTNDEDELSNEISKG
ncbi:TPM domain-containing protein [Tenacibaculum sp. E3R01]|uniref:TPM domain-containing protein n=1 Tax=unclassified Tenacibaculum TaxID=2635139 RepID=UPI00089688B1|nr:MULTISPECIES: TPM domain-containing protein [unclassified Tenacibaculum]RBW55237.1 TPM domain-containing protein [Tenacibaculum sp. E3R01]SEE21089.1 TLP18.3, Psb32 and MOLO-1 founding protein of phosphatase [Tenacibaculum sp. MAR_2010_89]